MPYKFLNLQLFGDEGDMAGDVGFATDTDTAGNLDTEGVATQGEGEQVAPVEEESFDSLIKGKYKKEYDAAISNAIQKRFKNSQNLQQKIDSIDPIIRTIAQRYGLEANPDGSISIEALQEKINADDSMYEKEAFERGLPVDELKKMKQMEYELGQIRRQQVRTKEQQEWDGIVSQSNELKQMYPSFDLDAEMQDSNFGRLLATFQRSGFPNAVQLAYEAVHRDDIMGGAMKYAVEQTKQKISNSIQSGIKRPEENGTRQQSSTTVGNIDPSKLTKEQLEDIKRRAERGERITF